jgi:rRNA maturation RNase YbeY
VSRDTSVGAARGSRGGGEIEIAWLNPNRYSEAAARRLRPWLAGVLAELAPARCRTLGVRFAGDRGMRRANRDFRGKDQPTDVLSFPGACGPGAAGSRNAAEAAAGTGTTGRLGDAGGHLGDILISVPAARRQAAAAGHDTESELQVLLLHGVLHCLGYDHEADGGEMERLERRLRRRWIGSPAAAGRQGGRGGRGKPGGRAQAGSRGRPGSSSEPARSGKTPGNGKPASRARPARRARGGPRAG